MITIAPSLLSADFMELGSELKAFDGIENLWFHLDIMDGHFVPNLTFGEPVLNKVKTISHHKLDGHFMVTNPEFYIENFKNVGLHNFTYHWEAVSDHEAIISKIKAHYPSVGISIKPKTPVSAIPLSILSQIDLVLVMSVEPGFGGQKFMPEAIDKLIELDLIRHQNQLKFQIQVDGGITDENAGYVIQAGANNLVAGSYIFSEPNKNYAQRINKIR